MRVIEYPQIVWGAVTLIRRKHYLSIYLSIYISIYLSIYSIHLSFNLNIYISIYLPTYLSIYLSIYLSNLSCLPIYLSIYLSIYSLHLSFNLNINSAVFLSVCLSFYLCTCKLENEAFQRDFLNFRNWTSKTKQFCETYFKNGKSSAELMASCQYVLRSFHPICLEVSRLERNSVSPGHTKCCTCHAKSS